MSINNANYTKPLHRRIEMQRKIKVHFDFAETFFGPPCTCLRYYTSISWR